MMHSTTKKKMAAEAFGTFALVFAGTGAIVINEMSGGAITHVGVAVTFGLIVLAMIYAIGDVSGCHLNPAVTMGFYVARRFEGRMVIPYLLSQSAGAILASVTLRLMFPTSITLGGTNPADGALQSFVMELLLTLILMFVILSVSFGAKEKGLLAGVAIGAVIALEAMFAGPVSGASMNPARSLAPALVSMRLDNLWIYLVAPIMGAVASVDTVLPYRSDAPPFSPAWEKDMGLREAMVVSNVPIFQDLARRIGLARMGEAVNRLDYGNRAIGPVVDTFWLRGPLAISAVEQTRFLDRLARGVLPFPAEAQRAVREITLVERGPGWELHAKTGWQNGPGPGVGWWVGWVESGGRTHPFALNLDIRQRADGDLRQRLGRTALELLGVLPPAAPVPPAPGPGR
jgi:aquaporin Z